MPSGNPTHIAFVWKPTKTGPMRTSSASGTYYLATPSGPAVYAGVRHPGRGPSRERRREGIALAKIQESGERVVANVERVIVGKHPEVRLALVALLCRG